MTFETVSAIIAYSLALIFLIVLFVSLFDKRR